MSGKPRNPNHMKNLKPFKKNDPRINKKGAPKKLPALDILLAELLGEEKNGMTAADAVLRSIFAKALKGDVRAAELLLERAYGKVKQPIEDETKRPAESFNNVTFVFKGKEK